MSFEEEPDGELFDSRDRGMSYYVYDINGWGIGTGVTFVAWLEDE